ncbi:MAG: 16S rRNA (adenine(1518)-N(6)/adenine(1519)-N(6))-dimethyltransferase RsmA [Alphaproteobacteria bacterium]|nr:16S rRNA (adenine(1518)-N(6)/adenine(1519)-N(6))-dimethyltransferase RsmA [Alphaproteobacteria bacterium]
MEKLPTLRETVEQYGLLAKKSLGQNFLLDINITQKIIRSSLAAQQKADFSDSQVFEVGPGPGGLTRAVLAANPATMTVIEMDKRCIQIMEDLRQAGYAQLNIVEGDALKFDFASAAQTSPHNHVVSNLPYNVSVPLLLGWLKQISLFESLTLMFQKEVAERITAEPDHKNYGRLSVVAQLTCHIKTLMNLNPNCFVPAPKIWSTVLLFRPLDVIPTTEILQKVEKITELAFGQRRKMLRQSLKAYDNLDAVCQKLGIETTLRAENLTPQQYLLLAQNL